MNIESLILYCFIVTFSSGMTNIVILSTTNHFGTKKDIQYTYKATAKMHAHSEYAIGVTLSGI